MEKWKSRGKCTKAESVLPPTRRPTGPTCLPVDKKKDRKWSIGGLLRRISSGQNHDVSSNDEDITYIPGHMLSKRNTKKPSKMKSKLGKIPHRTESKELPDTAAEISYGSKDTLELIRSLQANIDQSQDSLCQCNDSVNSRSSEGSLDALGKASRINRMKARAQAKRDRLCGNTSSDDDSHRSSQSLAQLRSDDSAQNGHATQRSDSCNRKTRAARTERYIRRMYRDDGTSGSDSKILEPKPLPRVIGPAPSQYSSKSMDSSLWRTNDTTRGFSQGGSSPSVIPERSLVVDRHFPARERPPQILDRPASGCLRDMNENETFEREKRTWPQSFRRATPLNEIYGSLRQPKVLPPEPPPRSSKSRVFTNAYNNAPFAFNAVNPETQTSRRYLSPIDTQNGRSYNSDNDVLLSDYVAPVRLRYLWQNTDEAANRQETNVQQDHQPCYQKNSYCNSLDRPRRQNYSPATRRTMNYREEQENYDPRPYFPEAIPPPSEFAVRTSSSLPKGVQLFSRQRLSHCSDDTASFASQSTPNSTEKPLEEHIIPKLRKPREISSCQSPSISSTRTVDDDEAERKRSSKNLEDALSELEAIYNSLRLSDEDLLERAEQRSMEEYRDKAAKSAVENAIKSSDTSSNEKEEMRHDRSLGLTQQQENDVRMKDDMAYRRMNPKERPPSVNGQASLSQISYLATSPNLSVRDGDFFDQRPRSRRGTPDLTRDDLLFRSISHANNTLKVIEPQPPFGIPIGPVTSATESDYLHVKPSKIGQTRSLYIPKSEPDVVSDDLAFRNLRKDAPKDFATNFNKNNNNLFIQTDSSTCDSPIFPKSTFAFATKKKRAVRSMSADLYGIMSKEKSKQNDWYNDYIQSTQKLRVLKNETSPIDKENLSYRNFEPLRPKSLDEEGSRDTFLCTTNHIGLDINGNRPKSALQRKIQVYVPQETAIVKTVDKSVSTNDEMLDDKSRDLLKLISEDESDDSSPERCHSRLSSKNEAFASNDKTTTIQSFTEQELSEYKQLCQDLEKLIQRTAEADEAQENNAEEKDIIKEASEDNNSQSEFDELEKLLIDDYDIAASVAAFDEIVTSTERDDDQSSSRSTGHGAESLSSDNLQSSPSKTASKFADDDASSTSELGIGSSNTGSSFTDSVYDKFNQLLKEVNDVPYVEPTKTINKYPIDEIDATTNLPQSERSIDDDLINENSEKSIKKETQETTDVKATYDDSEVKTEAIIGSKSMEEILAKDESPKRPLRARKGGKRDEDESNVQIKEIGGVEKTANRQGENVEDDERGCNEGFCAFKDTSKHTVRKLCHVTNRVTAYQIVLCSLFLTLLITMIVAQ